MASLNSSVVHGSLAVTGEIHGKLDGTIIGTVVTDLNAAIPALQNADTYHSVEYFSSSSSASNVPDNTYNWHVEANLYKFINGSAAAYRVTQFATGTGSAKPSAVYERSGTSSDGTTWSFGAWTSLVNVDTKVTQTAVTANATYPLLLAQSGQTATTTTTANFDSGVTLNPSTNTIAANISGTAATATSVSATEGTANVTRHVWFSDSNVETKRAYDGDFIYNPTTNELTVGSITGNAATATTADKVGHSLTFGSSSFDGSADKTIAASDLGITADSSATSITVGSVTVSQYTHPTTEGYKHIPSGGSSGQFLGWSSAGTATWVANPNTDTKVIQTSKADNVEYPLLAAASTSPTSGSAAQAIYDSGVTLNPSTNTITGNVSGYSGKLTYTVRANTTTPNINDTSMVKVLIATSSMTTAKPSSDGWIMHFNWDGDYYASQIAIPNYDSTTTTTAKIQFRQRFNKLASDDNAWSDWGALPADITGKATYDSDGNKISTSFLKLSGGTLTGALTVQGTTSASSYAVSGGAFSNGSVNMILRGSETTGSSGIVFTSSMGTTSINQTTDRAFIQYHPYGITPAEEGSTPTIGTSGEKGAFVIGIGNDSDSSSTSGVEDTLYLQAPSRTGVRHLSGASERVILDQESQYGYIDTSIQASCDTASANTAKVAVMRGFALYDNAVIRMKMYNANSAVPGEDETLTLNVNGTGDKPIYLLTGDNTWTKTSSDTYTIAAGVYDCWYHESADAWYLLESTTDNIGLYDTKGYVGIVHGQDGYDTVCIFVDRYNGQQYIPIKIYSDSSSFRHVICINGISHPIATTEDLDAGLSSRQINTGWSYITAESHIGSYTSNFTFYRLCRPLPYTQANMLTLNSRGQINFTNTSENESVYQRVIFNGVDGDTGRPNSSKLITSYYFDNRAGGYSGVTLYADSFSGTATKAIGDSAGTNILQNYMKSSSGNKSLSWGSSTIIGTVNGANVTITMPAKPDESDTKQNITLATTTKAYITGVSTEPTSTAQAMAGLADTGVYLTTTAGQMNAATYKINEKVTMQYNSTNSALDFVFA